MERQKKGPNKEKPMDNRRQSFENKYVHDDQTRFKVEARCAKLFGLWIAEQLKLQGAEASAYAAQMVESNLEEPGFDDMKRAALRDLAEKGVSISEHLIDTRIESCLEAAKDQILQELPE